MAILAVLLAVCLIQGFQALTTTSAPCAVNMTSLAVQQNFNFTAFMGKWYELRWWDGINHLNDKHALEGLAFEFTEPPKFQPSQPEALATLYGYPRDSAEKKCVKLNYGGKAKLYNVSSTEPAKMRYLASSTLDSHFWVINTDYKSALVIQCSGITNDTCDTNVKINIFNRKILSINSKTLKGYYDYIIQNLCVQDPENAMVTTKLDKDCEQVMNHAGRLFFGIPAILLPVIAIVMTKFF
ncbi:uncharacterized protein LOC141898232 [Tubulanus polymorphus]|uniref:uncharacterized protein LOC141898232 n=1 Tax=Tubulanus polymorphus TaxID=672921 RepID=UPI003DA58710